MKIGRAVKKMVRENRVTHNIHFVGSIGLEDADTVFRTLAEIIGNKARRYPDGETGERRDWTNWQRHVFAEHPDFNEIRDGFSVGPALRAAEQFRLRDGADVAKLEFPPIGYAREALNSYEIFTRLRDAGVVPADVRFQASLPTPLAVLAAFIAPENCADVEPAYDRAMQRDVEAIVAGIPNDDLAIQWDVCIEVLAYEGAMPLYENEPLHHACGLVGNMANRIPDEVDVGIHLCYGDPGHAHIVEPGDLGTSVLFANALAAASPSRLAWIHVAVPRDRDDETYFAPLSDLDIGETELVLGLVHRTDGPDGTRRRMTTADKFISNYGIATECGFGRRPADSIPGLLRIHADAAG